MTDQEKQERLESAIIDMLKHHGYIFMDDSGPNWVSDTNKTAELWNEGGIIDYISNLAHDMLAVFGDLALILVTPVVMIQNFSYNFYNQTDAGSLVADFEVMKAVSE